MCFSVVFRRLDHPAAAAEFETLKLGAKLVVCVTINGLVWPPPLVEMAVTLRGGGCCVPKLLTRVRACLGSGNLGVHRKLASKARLTLASLDLPRTSAASGLASGASEAFVALCRALINLFDNLTGGSPWLHLGDRQRPSPRILLAALAKPEATGVAHCPNDVRPRRPGQCTPPHHSALSAAQGCGGSGVR
ncbi:hypothetical protein TYRP_017681 [Tyrophagus putrescentiae]|nr:hypothetical protein TYRP_017681 [Tyrophagus putrescentiae]